MRTFFDIEGSSYSRWWTRENLWLFGVVPVLLFVGFESGVLVTCLIIAFLVLIALVQRFSPDKEEDIQSVPNRWKQTLIEVVECSELPVKLILARDSQQLPSYSNRVLTIPTKWFESWEHRSIEWMLVSCLIREHRRRRVVNWAGGITLCFLNISIFLYVLKLPYTPPTWLMPLPSSIFCFASVIFMSSDSFFSRSADRFATDKLGKEAAERSLNRLWLEKKRHMMLPITLDDIEKRAKYLGITLTKIEPGDS
jgi:hypothetical protein